MWYTRTYIMYIMYIQTWIQTTHHGTQLVIFVAHDRNVFPLQYVTIRKDDDICSDNGGRRCIECC